MLDLDFVRRHFPALSGDWTLMDNAGGSVPLGGVIDAVAEHMSTRQVQLGASYALSAEAKARVVAGHDAMAELIGAEPGEVVIGPSATVNLQVLARALRPLWSEGDEVVVTNLDHETNVAPWRGLEVSGMVVKEWRVRPETASLELKDLDALLTERTRLVAFSHCSNIVGEILDAAAIVRRIHDAGALACIDGVAYAPHGFPDVRALDADFYAFSLYKTYGPHQGLLYGKRQHLERARGQYFFFVPEDDVPYKFQPGGPNHELVASLPAIGAYLDNLAEHCGADPSTSQAARRAHVQDVIAKHEERLMAPILDFLHARPGVRLIGPSSSARIRRVPTISFVVEGRQSSEIPPLLDREKIAIRYGDFYAYRLIRDLELADQDGVVRVSLVHYNTPEEVDRLLEILDRTL